METLTKATVEHWWEEFTKLPEAAGPQWLQRVQEGQPALWGFLLTSLRKHPAALQQQGMLFFLLLVYILDHGIAGPLRRVPTSAVAAAVQANEETYGPHLGNREDLRRRIAEAPDGGQPHLKAALAEAVLGIVDPELTDRQVGLLFLLLTTAIDAFDTPGNPHRAQR